MNFIEAVALLNKDEHISMKRSNGYFEVKSSVGYLSVSGELYSPMSKDILAEDWYVVKDEKLHTFEEVLVAFRAGKTISREDKNDRNLRYKMGWSKTLHFKEEDLLANDWVIVGEKK